MLARYSTLRRLPKRRLEAPKCRLDMFVVAMRPLRQERPSGPDKGVELWPANFAIMELRLQPAWGTIAKMESEQVKAKLLRHVPELNEAGIVHLDVCGSVARGEATSSSDVDLIADFDRARRLTLFDLAGLESRLSDILEAPVDLSDRRMLKDDVRVRAQREGVLVF
jgi:uncharacterized protein